MEGFLRGKCLPGDLLVGESHAAYLVRKLNGASALKAERDAFEAAALASRDEWRAQQKRADALAVENAALKASASDLRKQAFNGRRNSHNCGPFQYSDLCESIIESAKVATPTTDAALAAIELRGVERAVEYTVHESSRAEFINPDVSLAFAGLADDLRKLANELREAK
jgi:hypothetical protein